MVGDSLGYRDHVEVACGVLGYGGCGVVGVVKHWSLENRQILERRLGRELPESSAKVTLKVSDLALMMEDARKHEQTKKPEPKSDWEDTLGALKRYQGRAK